jgi:ATP citrate (pro-S)-lyase
MNIVSSFSLQCLQKVRSHHDRHATYADSFIAIREYDAKLLLAYWLQRAPAPNPNFAPSPSSALKFPAPRVAQILWDPATDSITPDTLLPSWVSTTKLVAKPDQLIKRRGKAGLLALNKDWQDAKKWIQDRAGKPQRVSCYLI